jgi:hypothetical protein
MSLYYLTVDLIYDFTKAVKFSLYLPIPKDFRSRPYFPTVSKFSGIAAMLAHVVAP